MTYASSFLPCLIAVAARLTGCAPKLLPMLDHTEVSDRLGSGYAACTIRFGKDQLTGEFRVDEQGEVAIPPIRQINAAGLTTRQLQCRITEQLK